jgi:hypothetical protein
MRVENHYGTQLILSLDSKQNPFSLRIEGQNGRTALILARLNVSAGVRLTSAPAIAGTVHAITYAGPTLYVCKDVQRGAAYGRACALFLRREGSGYGKGIYQTAS